MGAPLRFARGLWKIRGRPVEFPEGGSEGCEGVICGCGNVVEVWFLEVDFRLAGDPSGSIVDGGSVMGKVRSSWRARKVLERQSIKP